MTLITAVKEGAARLLVIITGLSRDGDSCPRRSRPARSNVTDDRFLAFLSFVLFFSTTAAPAAVPALASDGAQEHVGRCEPQRAVGPLGGVAATGTGPARRTRCAEEAQTHWVKVPSVGSSLTAQVILVRLFVFDQCFCFSSTLLKVGHREKQPFVMSQKDLTSCRSPCKHAKRCSF